MSKEKVYEMFFQCMGECWEWAYDKPENAVAYFDGLWTMAETVIEKIETHCGEADENRTSVSEPF